MPGITHWNHPGFFAYFSITGSAPGVLAEFLVGRAQRAGDAVAHVAGGDGARGGHARLAAPADRPARHVRRGHLRHGVDLDAARARRGARSARPGRAQRAASPGRRDVPRLRVYCSDQTHSSIDKAVILLGLGHESLRKIPERCRVPHAARPARSGDRGGPRRRVAADRRRRDRRHDLVDERRSGRRDRRDLPARIAVAARRRRVRRRRRDGAGLRVDPARRGAGRFARREPAQVAVHAVRSERVLLPAHGRGARRVLAHARVPQDGRDRARAQPDGHGRSARPAVPRAEALDGAAPLRRRWASRAVRRTHAARARVRRMG